MIYQDILLHNVVELEPAEGGGVFLRRFPRSVRDALSPLGRMVSQESAGVELRFVTESPHFRLSLSCLPSVLAPYEQNHPDVCVFRGAFFHSQHRLIPGQLNSINIVNIAEKNQLETVRPEATFAFGFSPQVWRIFLGRFPAAFLGLETYGFPHRPPQASEIPSRRWIAYGSSITNGASPTVHSNSYIYHAARTAHADVYNQGLSGSCQCEPEIAAYLASRNDWDGITLELGVNMRSKFTPAEFRERTERLICRVCAAHPHSPVVLITIYPNSASAGFTRRPGDEAPLREAAFNAILRDLAAAGTYPNLTLLEGADLLDEFGSLTVDLVHPSDYGHIRLGHRLGRHLATLLPEGNAHA